MLKADGKSASEMSKTLGITKIWVDQSLASYQRIDKGIGSKNTIEMIMRHDPSIKRI
jgi:hypothetical protein